jgi:glycosyltransferase involved in cell wall biosynthesis
MYATITVNSADTAGEYADFPKRYTERIVYVPHGFKDKSSALTKQQAREKFGLPQTVTLLGSVARLNAMKRLDIAVRALVHDESWHLVLGGQGPDEINLRQLAADLGVSDRTYFTGEMESNEVGDLLAAMDLFVFPSEAETFGLAAVEAAQTGLPVVSNGIPVLREVLKTDSGPCSLFADSEDPDSFIAPIRTLLSDKDQAQALIQSSKKLKTMYSMDAMVDRYEKILSDKEQAELTIKGVSTA